MKSYKELIPEFETAVKNGERINFPFIVHTYGQYLAGIKSDIYPELFMAIDSVRNLVAHKFMMTFSTAKSKELSTKGQTIPSVIEYRV